MFKSVLQRFSSTNNNQFIPCLTQSVNPALFIEVLEVVLSYVKSPNRTTESEATIEFYFASPNPFMRNIRDKFTLKKSICEDVSSVIFYNEKYILPNPLSIEVKLNNLLPDESVELTIIYNEQEQLTIDELAQRYL